MHEKTGTGKRRAMSNFNERCCEVFRETDGVVFYCYWHDQKCHPGVQRMLQTQQWSMSDKKRTINEGYQPNKKVTNRRLKVSQADTNPQQVSRNLRYPSRRPKRFKRTIGAAQRSLLRGAPKEINKSQNQGIQEL